MLLNTFYHIFPSVDRKKEILNHEWMMLKKLGGKMSIDECSIKPPTQHVKTECGFWKKKKHYNVSFNPKQQQVLLEMG